MRKERISIKSRGIENHGAFEGGDFIVNLKDKVIELIKVLPHHLDIWCGSISFSLIVSNISFDNIIIPASFYTWIFLRPHKI